MKSVSFRCRIIGVFAACAWLAQSATAEDKKAQPVHYTVTDLGLTGPTPGPLAITNNNLFANSMAVSNAWHATISFLGLMQVDLAKAGGLGGPNSSTFGVNEWGLAAGQAETAESNSEDFCADGTQRVCQAFVWQNGLMQPLPLLKGANGVAGRNAGAKGVNILGQVAGVAENTTTDSTCPASEPKSLQFQKYQFKPVIWENGEIQALPTTGNDSNGKAFEDPDGVVFSINDRGQAVGGTGTCTGFTNFSYLNSQHATLWENGSLIDLGNLGGVAPGFGNFSYDVNASGHVVGTSGTADGSFHAFFWSPETLIQDVGAIPANGATPADAASIGLAISDVGDVGGVSFPPGSLLATPTASPRAFIRPDGGTPEDLNSLVPANSELYLFSACSINSRGEIIGLAVDAQGNFHGYLATPSDEAWGPLDASSLAIQAARFESAWKLAGQRMGSILGTRR